MGIANQKFRRLERLRLIFLLLLIFCGLIMIQFKIPNPVLKDQIIEINKTGVYLVAVFLAVFAVLWNFFSPKKFIQRELSFFAESVVYLIGITLVVYFTGGTYSLFSFLYFLPVLNVASNLNFKYSIATTVLATLLLSLPLVGTSPHISFSDSFNLYLVNLFGIFLVTALGRFLITELTVINKRQEQLKIEQLQQLDKIKDEFVFIIAHELRSPITAIRGYLELINTDTKVKIEDNLKNLLNRSFSTANKLATLVSLLLEVARIETGKISFYFQKIDLKDSIDFVLSSMRKDIEGKEIQLTINVPTENLILIDKERLEEILVILIENAIQFTPEYGKILISSQISDKHVLLSVADSGVGIPDDMRNKLFEKLYTENTNTGDVKIKGYGIGLYVAKQLLLRMSGDISFESVLGKGTTFTLKLPKYWAFGK